MFGSKNKENLETIDHLSKDLEAATEICDSFRAALPTYEGETEEFTTSSGRMEEDLTKFAENLDASGALLSENAKDINGLSENIKLLLEGEKSRKDAAEKLTARIEKTAEESMTAVENNKHFTPPSKALTEIADNMKKQYQEDGRQLKLMAEYSKQMSVLALNAAIEAGRMGDSGRQFVTSCESMRSYAGNYDKSAREMLERSEETQKQVAELDEQVRILINLMKENNVAVSKLMKELGELSKESRKNLEQSAEETIQASYSQLETIWDRESQIDKAEARNRMELEDVRQECLLQRKNLNEISKALAKTVDLSKK